MEITIEKLETLPFNLPFWPVAPTERKAAVSILPWAKAAKATSVYSTNQTIERGNSNST